MSKLNVFFLPLFISMLAGCQSTGVVESDSLFSNVGLTHHRRDLVLKDIPLPEDFVLLPKSFHYGTGSFRYGELLYTGNLSVDDIYFYYQKQMDAHGWTAVSLKQFETNARLSFRKGAELCTILVREGDSMSDMKIIVEQKKS